MKTIAYSMITTSCNCYHHVTCGTDGSEGAFAKTVKQSVLYWNAKNWFNKLPHKRRLWRSTRSGLHATIKTCKIYVVTNWLCQQKVWHAIGHNSHGIVDSGLAISWWCKINDSYCIRTRKSQTGPTPHQYKQKYYQTHSDVSRLSITNCLAVSNRILIKTSPVTEARQKRNIDSKS